MKRTSTRFGQLLYTLRKRAGLTQRALGVITNYCEGHICRFERGHTPPALSVVLERFVPALGIADRPEEIQALLTAAQEARGEVQSRGFAREPASPAATSPAATVQPSALTKPHGPLFGRARELADCLALLLDPHVHLLTLTGPPGVGKTRLSVSLARAAAKHFGEPVWVFASLINDPAQLPAAFAQAIGAPANKDSTSACVAMLKTRRRLIIIDNLEHLLAASDQVASWISQLLAEPIASKILITSQTSLRTMFERTYQLGPLPLPAFAPVPSFSALQNNPAIQLFTAAARMADPAFELTRSNCLAVAGICAQVDGLPLGIELAAARIRMFTPQRLLGRLASSSGSARLRLIGSGLHAGADRHQSLHNAIAWSVQLLKPRLRQIFAGFGVLTGGADLDLAARVAGADLDALEALVGHSLLQVEKSETGEPFFTMLDPLRRAAQSIVSESARQVLLEKLARVMSERMARLRAQSPCDRGAMRQARRDHANLEEALRWLIVHDPLAAVRLCVDAYYAYINAQGYVRSGLEWLERALAACADIPADLHAEALWIGGCYATRLLKYAEAIRWLKESYARSADLGDYDRQFHVLHELGWSNVMYADISLAKSYFERARALADALDNDVYRALSDSNFATMHILSNHDLTTAADLLSRAYVVLIDNKAFAHAVNAAMHLSAIDLWRGEYDAAIDRLTRALSLTVNHELTASIAWAHSYLAETQFLRGEFAAAASHARTSQGIFTELDYHHGISITLHHLARAELMLGHQAEALECLLVALRMHNITHNEVLSARCLIVIAHLCKIQAGKKLLGAQCAMMAAGILDTTPPCLFPPDVEELRSLCGYYKAIFGDAIAKPRADDRKVALERLIEQVIAQVEPERLAT